MTSKYPFLRAPREEDEIGRLGNFRVLRLLGEGGMGFVFLAEDLALRRQVALKVMKAQPNRPNRSKRFLREAQALAKLKHEHLVPVYHAEQIGDTVFYAMELLEGESLAARVERKPLSAKEIVRIAREIADGLAFIHRQKMVHRDIKPANIWLEAPNGRVKILDLGLVRPLDDEVGITRAGIVVGSLGFMSPEQARGEAIDVRSDLFSFGCVLYHLCTRVPAFDGNSAAAQLTALATQKPRPVQKLNPKIPESLAKLVMHLLAKSPKSRPASADDVRDQLERIAGRPTAVPAVQPARWKKLAVVGSSAIVAAALAVGVTLWLSAPPAPAVLHPNTPVAALPVAVEPPMQPDDDPAPDDPPDEKPPAEKVPEKPLERAVGENVFLSDLAPARTENLHKDGAFADKLRREGRPTSHGIFAFLTGGSTGPVTMAYNLDKKYPKFYTAVSIWDVPSPKKNDFVSKFLKKPSVKPPATCDFAVYGDDRLLWQSKGVTAQGGRQDCTVEVPDVKVLRITLTAPRNFRGVHAVWFEPHLGK